MGCGEAADRLADAAAELPTVAVAEDSFVPDQVVDLAPVDQGGPGRSALREHQRRRKNREDRAREKLGVILVDGPKRTAQLTDRPGILTPEIIDAIWRRLTADFPSA